MLIISLFNFDAGWLDLLQNCGQMFSTVQQAVCFFQKKIFPLRIDFYSGSFFGREDVLKRSVQKCIEMCVSRIKLSKV